MLTHKTSNLPNEMDVGGISSAKQVVSRRYFPVGSTINQQHIDRLFGDETEKWSKKEYDLSITEIRQVRSSAQSWGRAHVEGIILQAFLLWKDAGVSVHTMRDLKAAFADDSTPEFAAKMWQSVYGSFDSTPGWEVELEEEYMDFASFVYPATLETQKGCFARLFVDTKKEVIKAINRATKPTHGGTIKMKRTAAEEVLITGKFKKRKKGTCMGLFYSGATAQDDLKELVKKEVKDDDEQSELSLSQMENNQDSQADELLTELDAYDSQKEDADSKEDEDADDEDEGSETDLEDETSKNKVSQNA